jgi:hypothetical protein
MRSFKSLIQEVNYDADITPDNGIFAGIRNEGASMRNFNETINYPSWHSQQETLNKFPAYVEAEKKYGQHFEEGHELSNNLEAALKDHHDPEKIKKHGKIIKEYTRNSMIPNSALWSTHKEPKTKPDFKSTFDERIKPLDKAIKAHKIPHDIHVYSSTAHDPRILKNSEGIVHHPAYLSTSLDPHVAVMRETNNVETKDTKGPRSDTHVLHIKNLAGRHGVVIGDNEKLTDYPNESEVVLNRGLKMHHDKTDTFKHPTKNLYLHIHHMSIV